MDSGHISANAYPIHTERRSPVMPSWPPPWRSSLGGLLLLLPLAALLGMSTLAILPLMSRGNHWISFLQDETPPFDRGPWHGLLQSTPQCTLRFVIALAGGSINTRSRRGRRRSNTTRARSPRLTSWRIPVSSCGRRPSKPRNRSDRGANATEFCSTTSEGPSCETAFATTGASRQSLENPTRVRGAFEAPER